MKTVFLFAIMMFFSLTGFSQNSDKEMINTSNTIEIKENTKIIKPEAISSRMQNKVKKLNHKKSNEIISIKAYRKSLNVKVKATKLC